MVSTLQQSTDSHSLFLQLVLPASFGFEIEDPSAPPVLGLANTPSLSWAIGVPSVTDAGTALKHQVYDCGAEPGEPLRIFGKTLSRQARFLFNRQTLPSTH